MGSAILLNEGHDARGKFATIGVYWRLVVSFMDAEIVSANRREITPMDKKHNKSIRSLGICAPGIGE